MKDKILCLPTGCGQHSPARESPEVTSPWGIGEGAHTWEDLNSNDFRCEGPSVWPLYTLRFFLIWWGITLDMARTENECFLFFDAGSLVPSIVSVFYLLISALELRAPPTVPCHTLLPVCLWPVSTQAGQLPCFSYKKHLAWEGAGIPRTKCSPAWFGWLVWMSYKLWVWYDIIIQMGKDEEGEGARRPGVASIVMRVGGSLYRTNYLTTRLLTQISVHLFSRLKYVHV